MSMYDLLYIFSPVNPVSWPGIPGFGVAEDHVRGAGLPSGRPECGPERRAPQAVAGAGAHGAGTADR